MKKYLGLFLVSLGIVLSCEGIADVLKYPDAFLSTDFTLVGKELLASLIIMLTIANMKKYFKE